MAVVPLTGRYFGVTSSLEPVQVVWRGVRGFRTLERLLIAQVLQHQRRFSLIFGS